MSEEFDVTVALRLMEKTRGHALDARGQPLSLISLGFEQSSSDGHSVSWKRSRTDADGQFGAHLDAGEWRVTSEDGLELGTLRAGDTAVILRAK